MALKPLAVRMLMWQLMITLAVALAWTVAGGLRSGAAALAGGACVVVPAGLFAVRMVRSSRSMPAEMVKAFYIGVVLKLLTTVVLLAVAVSLFADGLVPLLSALVAALMTQWIALIGVPETVPDRSGAGQENGER